MSNETNNAQNNIDESFINQKVLVRGDRSGVSIGTLVRTEGQLMLLNDVQKIHNWENALTCCELASQRDTKGQISKESPSVLILDVIELYILTPEAIASIKKFHVGKK